MYSIHITPRCRRPARGQVFLKTLRVDGDSFSFTLPSACFTLRPSPNPRVIFASDRRADGEMSGTVDKDFVIGKMIPKNTDNKQKEMAEYTLEKTLQYKNYLIEDIKKEQLPIQKQLACILGDELEIDGEKIKLNDYLLSNLEEEINSKIDELIHVLIWSKYGSITFYYDKLFAQILKEYKMNNTLNFEKIRWCIKIMNYYYDGVIGIDNLFNL